MKNLSLGDETLVSDVQQIGGGMFLNHVFGSMMGGEYKMIFESKYETNICFPFKIPQSFVPLSSHLLFK